MSSVIVHVQVIIEARVCAPVFVCVRGGWST